VNAKQIRIAIMAFLLFLSFLVIAPTYIDWLDSFFGRWSLWTLVVLELTFVPIGTVIAVGAVYLIAGSE
jgi:hypothetical protein